MATRSPFAVNVRDASAYVSVGELITILAAAEQTGGAFGLMESVLARGAEPPPHVHHREDESFFVLEGDLTVRVGDDTFNAAAGSFVFCPRDVPHLLTLHSEQVRALTLVTPGGLESFFVELGEPVPPGRRTLPADLPEPDPERVVTLAGHYGAEVLTNWP
jgi:quercetin dioxygenase-like cupin family protein